jgi:hypothetical protein
MLALAVAVSAAMLVWFVNNPLFGEVLERLHRIELPPLLLAIALVPLLQWLRGWRFSLLLGRSLALPVWSHYRLAAQLSFLNLVLPCKIGDFSFPLLAWRILRADLLHGAVTIVWCRLGDFCVVLGMLLLSGACLITPEGHAGYRLALLAAGLASLFLPLGLGSLRRLRGGPLLGRLLGRLPPGGRITYGRRAFLTLTVAIWATHSVIGYLAVRAVAADVALVAAVFASAAGNLAFALPVTGIAGLGPPQAAWTASLHLSGVAWDVAVASALLAYGCILLGAILSALPTLLLRQERLRPLVRAAAGARRRRQRWMRARFGAWGRPGMAVPAAAAAGALARPQRVGSGVSPR